MTHIKKLLWTDPQEPNNELCYHHVISTTPFGDITIDWKGWKDYPSYDVAMDFVLYEHFGSYDSLDEAMAEAERKWTELIGECFVVEDEQND